TRGKGHRCVPRHQVRGGPGRRLGVVLLKAALCRGGGEENGRKSPGRAREQGRARPGTAGWIPQQEGRWPSTTGFSHTSPSQGLYRSRDASIHALLTDFGARRPCPPCAWGGGATGPPHRCRTEGTALLGSCTHS